MTKQQLVMKQYKPYHRPVMKVLYVRQPLLQHGSNNEGAGAREYDGDFEDDLLDH